MENAVQILRNIRGKDKTVEGTRLTVLTKGPDEPVRGLCMNCLNYTGCTFPMRGRAIFCEEYE
jgi:hypothetical protein